MTRLLTIFIALILGTYAANGVAEYVKVANDGSALPLSSTLGTESNDWGCTYDSKTQLIWEIKTDDQGLRDKHWSYSWYNSNPASNGGFAGSSNGGMCFDKSNCDTEKFVQQVNKVGICGAHDWRLPTLDEIKSLIDPAFNNALNPYFFPEQNVPKSLIFGYWTSTNVVSPDPTPLKASYVLFEKASVIEDFKNKLHRISLVRDAKRFVPAASPELLLEDFDDKLLAGTAHGIVFDKTYTGRGGRFSRANQSNIRYPLVSNFPKSGTLEFRVKIKSAYRYTNFQLNANEACALLLSTELIGTSDDPWRGALKFMACKNGDITLLQTAQDGASQSIIAKATRFRFNQWHVISLSFGKKGQSLAMNGEVVAEVSQNNQELNTDNAIKFDTLVLGESISNVWQPQQYAAGFEGIIDTFRISRAQKDWILGIDRPKLLAKLGLGSFRKPNRTSAQAVTVLVNDYLQRHLYGKLTDQNWFQFFAKKGLRYTLEIPNDSVGNALNPGLEILDAQDIVQVNLIDNRGTGEGESLQWSAPKTGFYRVRISNQPPFKRESASSDDGYEFQIYLADEPQQGIIKGQALNTCNQSGVYQAEISAWLSDFVTDSTLTHSTGEFGLPLNPNDYDLRSIATNYQDSSQAISVIQTDVTSAMFSLSPSTACSDTTFSQPDPIVLQQQAGSIYDTETGSLIVRDVVAGETVLYAELHDIGAYHFQLDRILEIPQAIHTQPAIYDAEKHLVDLPNVFITDRLYKIQLKHDDNGIFSVEKVE